MKEILIKLLSNEMILGYIATAIAFLWSKSVKSAKLKDERINKGLLFLETGVEEVWSETVKELKKAAKDGKLTDDEKKTALKVAKDKAIAYAKADGWDLFTYIAEATIPVVIRNVVDGRKVDGRKNV